MTCLELVDGLYEEQIFKGDTARVTKPIDLKINFRELFGDVENRSKIEISEDF